jgi:uncharacterized protein
MIVDGHAHVGNLFGINSDNKKFIETMDIYGIDKSCVSSAEAFYYSVEGNDLVANLMKKYPERIIGFCVPNPYKDPVKEIRRCIENGFKGIKLHPWLYECPLSSSYYIPIFKEAEENNMPILFHSGGSLSMPDFKYATPDMIFSVAESFPELNFIVGHMGLERWKEFMEKAIPFKNIYLDITMSMPYWDRINMAVDAVGAEHVTFGTDMTLIEPAISLGLIENSNITEEEKKLILGGNILRLLDMKEDN